MKAEFFIVVPPGLEDLASRELKIKTPSVEILKQEKGGVMVTCELPQGFSLNQILKIPTAILWRVSEFRCRDLPKLYNKISNIRWGNYLINSDFSLSVSSSKSRLLNEKKISDTVSEGIKRHFQKQPAKKNLNHFAFEVLVRFFEDTCTVSINTGGDLLFKRGYKTLAGIAPIRENLAAALSLALHEERPGVPLLIDPMCGTGTLLLEAASFFRPSTERDFAFQNYVWLEDLTQNGEGLAGEHEPLYRQFQGYDRDEKAIELARQNLKNLKSEVSNTKINFDCGLIDDSDFMAKNRAEQRGPSEYSIICNPPYNKRLKINEKPEVYFKVLVEKLLKMAPVALGLIVPKPFHKSTPKVFGAYKLSREIAFANGGLPVVFQLYTQEA